MTRRLWDIAFLGSVVTLFDTGPAWAYLDPGTGSIMLQALLGGIAGAMVVGRLYWHRFRGFVASRFSGKPKEGAPARRAGRASTKDRPGE